MRERGLNERERGFDKKRKGGEDCIERERTTKGMKRKGTHDSLPSHPPIPFSGSLFSFSILTTFRI